MKTKLERFEAAAERWSVRLNYMSHGVWLAAFIVLAIIIARWALK